MVSIMPDEEAASYEYAPLYITRPMLKIKYLPTEVCHGQAKEEELVNPQLQSVQCAPRSSLL
jgi:hypothetical protein